MGGAISRECLTGTYPSVHRRLKVMRMAPRKTMERSKPPFINESLAVCTGPRAT